MHISSLSLLKRYLFSLLALSFFTVTIGFINKNFTASVAKSGRICGEKRKVLWLNSGRFCGENRDIQNSLFSARLSVVDSSSFMSQMSTPVTSPSSCNAISTEQLTPVPVIRFKNAFNRAIQRLSVIEQRLFFAAVSQIPKGALITPSTMLIVRPETLDRLGSYDRKHVYAQMKTAADTLFARQITFRDVDIDGTHYEAFTTRYVSAIAYREDSCVALSFGPHIIGFITELDKMFTYLTLEEIGGFRSQYTAPLYMMLSQYMHEKDSGLSVKRDGWFLISIEELRIRFDLSDKYQSYYDFKRYILDTAVKQINESKFTKFVVEYIPVEESKKGKQYTQIHFNMIRRDVAEGMKTPAFEFTLTEKQLESYSNLLAGVFPPKTAKKPLDVKEFFSYCYRHKLIGSDMGGQSLNIRKNVIKSHLRSSDFVRAIFDLWLRPLGYRPKRLKAVIKD